MSWQELVATVNSLGFIIIPVVALIWKGIQSRMHAENQESLAKINETLITLSFKIDNHINLDDEKHGNFGRRLDKLED